MRWSIQEETVQVVVYRSTVLKQAYEIEIKGTVMTKLSSVLIRLALFALCLSQTAVASSQQAGQQPAIGWKEGPTIGDLGGLAQLKIPEGFLFTDKKGAQKLLELTQNIPSGYEVGAVVPASDRENWFNIFEFNETGYIKDDEKDHIDRDALLKSLQDGTEQSNEIRKEKGWPAFHVIGWERPPFYDTGSHNLTWAIRGRNDSGGQSVNHSIRLLGRRGTMNADLVLGPDEYAGVVPRFNTLMGGLSFRDGHRYMDFIPGDKVASYGLTALIAGGVGAVAVKSGLLLKMWKVLLPLVLALKKVILFVLLGAATGIKRFMNWLRGKPQPGGLTPSPAGGVAPEFAQGSPKGEEIISLGLSKTSQSESGKSDTANDG